MCPSVILQKAYIREPTYNVQGSEDTVCLHVPLCPFAGCLLAYDVSTKQLWDNASCLWAREVELFVLILVLVTRNGAKMWCHFFFFVPPRLLFSQLYMTELIFYRPETQALRSLTLWCDTKEPKIRTSAFIYPSLIHSRELEEWTSLSMVGWFIRWKKHPVLLQSLGFLWFVAPAPSALCHWVVYSAPFHEQMCCQGSLTSQPFLFPG